MKPKKNAQLNDFGTYKNELQQIRRYKDPQKISVYIENNQNSSVVAQAFQVWEESLKGKIKFNHTQDPQEAQIYCKFVENLLTEEQESADRLGLTTLKFYNDNTIAKSYISLALKNIKTNKEIDSKTLQAVALHEIGHALGIVGHSNNKNDIMYPNTATYNLNKLSNKDINTVLEIYQD